MHGRLLGCCCSPPIWFGGPERLRCSRTPHLRTQMRRMPAGGMQLASLSMHSSRTLSHFHPEDARGDVFECRGAVTPPLPAFLSLDVGLLVSGAADGPQRPLVSPLSRAQIQRIGHRRRYSAA